jgi:phosphoribosylamine---glycine ligase
MRNYLFISKDGGILDLAWTVQKEGHAVRLFTEKKHLRSIGEGFVELVDDWRAQSDWADILVVEHVGLGAELEKLRSSGKLVIGGCAYTDQLELDRHFGQEEMKRHKINILSGKRFTSFPEAIEYVRANPDYYVVKPSGEIQDIKQLLFVGREESGEDVIRVLQAYEKTWGDDIHEFQLQKRARGVEIATAAFFNGIKFLTPIFVSFEHKKLFPGELGVATGEMGTSGFWINESSLFQSTLKKIEQTLQEKGYIGSVDINCIVNGNGIYPLEFTCRFGYPQTHLMQEGILEPWGELLWKLAHGQNFTIKTKRGFQVCALIVVPPFPFNDLKTFETFSQDAVGFHIQDLRVVNNEWLITGEEGIAMVVSGNGVTMQEARKQMYNRISNVILNNMYYRTDIGERWSEDCDKLISWGYL